MGLGSKLRGAGYGVQYDRAGRWRAVSDRDKSELARFFSDVESYYPDAPLLNLVRVLDMEGVLASREMLQTLDVISAKVRASDDFGERGCCVSCHIDWERDVVWPYLSDSSIKMLEAEHEKGGLWPSPRELKKHFVHEVSMMRKDKVPQGLIVEMIEHHANLLGVLEGMGPLERLRRRIGIWLQQFPAVT